MCWTDCPAQNTAFPDVHFFQTLPPLFSLFYKWMEKERIGLRQDCFPLSNITTPSPSVYYLNLT